MQATERISLRTTAHTKAVIEQASRMLGVSVSHFILSTMYEKAQQMIQNEHTWQVNESEWKALLAALDNPPPANQALKTLLKTGEDIASR